MKRRIVITAAVLLAACTPDYEEVVVAECIRDGESARYCRCQADGMKQALGVRRYAVFTDFILLVRQLGSAIHTSYLEVV